MASEIAAVASVPMNTASRSVRFGDIIPGLTKAVRSTTLVAALSTGTRVFGDESGRSETAADDTAAATTIASTDFIPASGHLKEAKTVPAAVAQNPAVQCGR